MFRAIPDQQMRAAALATEERHLGLVERHIVSGECRPTRQIVLVAGLRRDGSPAMEAERLLALLEETLVQWHRQRKVIFQRMRAVGAAFPSGEPPVIGRPAGPAVLRSRAGAAHRPKKSASRHDAA